MSGSASTQIIQVENLLRSFNATLPVHAADTAALTSFRRFDSRPVIAVGLAFLVFAPGCAAAAVFLMRADGNVPPAVRPERNPPIVLKSDRLPLDKWRAEAAELLGVKENTRFAAMTAAEDPGFLAPFLIRGSLEEGPLPDVASSVIPASIVSADPILSPPRLRPKRDFRRTRLAKAVVEAAPVEAPQPTFLEKLFGSLTR